MAMKNNSGSSWMWGITISIAFCIIFFVGFAIWTSIGDVELVYDNYYDKDVVYEQQINRIKRTEALPQKPQIKYVHPNTTLSVFYPQMLRDPQAQGEILMFRPADLHKDRLFKLELQGDSLQVVSVPGLASGLWRVKLSWSANDLEYYLEQPLFVK